MANEARVTRALLQIAVNAASEAGTARATRAAIQVAVASSAESGVARATRAALQVGVARSSEINTVRVTRAALQIAVPPDPYLINDRITSTQRAYIQGVRAGHYMLIEVKDIGGTWQNLAAQNSQDYVLRATITQQLETPATSAVVSIRAGLGNASIAPLMTTAAVNATAPLLDLARSIRIRMCILPPPATPVSTDYVTVFLGTIDTINANDGQTITLNCRDLLAQILDASFDSTKSYGDGSTAAETILQTMLTDVLGAAAPTLITVVSPAWAPPGLQYKIVAKRGDSLWAKMAEVTDQIGWLVRYRWNGPDISELRFFVPDRTATVAKYTLIPFEVRSVQGAALDLSGIRNTVQVLYTVSAVQYYYTAQSGSSVALYGVRKLIIAEAKTSQINSAATAKRMADAILTDTQLPPFTHTLQMTHCFWAPEAGDVIDIPSDATTHDQTQRLAVSAIELTLDNNGAGNYATIQFRGQPASRGRSWLAFAGTSSDPASGTGSPSSISALTVTNTGSRSTSGNMVATWTGVGLPSGGDYQCVVSGSSFIAASTTNGATSPRTISGGVYTDGISPPGGKIGPDYVFITINMRDASGNIVATRSQLSAGFFHL